MGQKSSAGNLNSTLQNLQQILPRLSLATWFAEASIKAGSQLPLEELLAVFLAEADPLLRPGYLKLDDVAKWGGLSGPPPRAAFLSLLQSR